MIKNTFKWLLEFYQKNYECLTADISRLNSQWNKLISLFSEKKDFSNLLINLDTLIKNKDENNLYNIFSLLEELRKQDLINSKNIIKLRDKLAEIYLNEKDFNDLNSKYSIRFWALATMFNIYDKDKDKDKVFYFYKDLYDKTNNELMTESIKDRFLKIFWKLNPNSDVYIDLLYHDIENDEYWSWYHVTDIVNITEKYYLIQYLQKVKDLSISWEIPKIFYMDKSFSWVNFTKQFFDYIKKFDDKEINELLIDIFIAFIKNWVFEYKYHSYSEFTKNEFIKEYIEYLLTEFDSIFDKLLKDLNDFNVLITKNFSHAIYLLSLIIKKDDVKKLCELFNDQDIIDYRVYEAIKYWSRKDKEILINEFNLYIKEKITTCENRINDFEKKQNKERLKKVNKRQSELKKAFESLKENQISFYLINEFLNDDNKDKNFDKEKIDDLIRQLNLFFSDDFKEWDPWSDKYKLTLNECVKPPFS